MYEAFFLLRTRPFGAGGCWLAPQVGHALQHAVASLQNGSEAVLVSGPTGSGKTTVCHELAQQMSPRVQAVVLAHCEFSSVAELWRTILFELGLECASPSADEARLSVLRAARALRPQRDGLLIVADDADALSDTLLEELRRLTVQRHEGRPVIQIVLSGSFELEERLAKPELSSLSQRIGQHLVLELLTREQSRQYIEHRVQAAGGRLCDVFTDEALAAIAAACDGNLHCLNQLCDHALLLAFTSEERPVSGDTVAAALEDLKGLSLPWNLPATQIMSADAESGTSADGSPSSAQQAGEPNLDAANEDTHLVLDETSGDRQSWWDDAGDAAAIEVGATQTLMQATLSPPEQCSMTSSMNTDGEAALPAAARDTNVGDVVETAVHDTYAALDRQSELKSVAAAPVPAVPVRSMRSSAPVEPTREQEQHASQKRDVHGVETRLLIDVTDLRKEIRASAAAPVDATKRTPPVRDMAPTQPDWDIVQPEPDVAELADWPVRSHAAAADASHRRTETMIDVADLQSDGGESAEHRSDSTPQRRYARLFTRLQQRRAATAAESATSPLRLWR